MESFQRKQIFVILKVTEISIQAPFATKLKTVGYFVCICPQKVQLGSRVEQRANEPLTWVELTNFPSLHPADKLRLA